MHLTENEKRDALKLIQAGKPLPEKYRFLLFDDDREVELVWNGKTNEVTNVVLPFQVIEQIDEPRSNATFGNQTTMFDTSGRQITGWTNKLIWGDNKPILSSLKNGPLRKEIEAQGGLKLIYIDPPFDVGADFSMDITIGDGEAEESFTKKPSVIEEIAFRDTWGNGTDSFIAMIYERLKLMRDLLAEDGSIYVHCDWRLNSPIRVILNELFGEGNYRNEIIWQRDPTGKGAKKISRQLPKEYDSILFYSKTDRYFYSQPYRELTDKQKAVYSKIEVETGRRFKLVTLGDYSEKSIKKMEIENLIYTTSTGTKYKKYYLDESVDTVGSIWTDLKVSTGTKAKESMGYPTQKTEGLLQRIIETSTNANDLVADFFCGSGTTLAVAEKLGRKWIGSDLGKFAIHTSRKRLIGVQRELKKAGKDFRAFEILNIGRYERESFLAVNDDLRSDKKSKQAERKEKEFVQLILSAYKAEPVESFVNIVGKKRDRLVAVGPINTPVSSKLVQDIVAECKEQALTKIDMLGFDYEMGMDFEGYKEQGVDIAFRIIPRDVFDKKAVEKGQVRFYDVAFIEAKPIVKGRGNTKELSIALNDFSVFYNQDDSGEVAEALRPGGVKVVVENGQVIKISKDKATDLVEKEVLTKKWSDWIDYWAVDFDFASRKEIIKVMENGEEKEVWTGDYIFDNEWQSFRTKKNRNLELMSVAKEVPKGTYKVAVKVVDIFGNDTTRVINVDV